jgi:hypothetical protein
MTKTMKRPLNRKTKLKHTGVWLAVAIGSAGGLCAQTAAPASDDKIKQLENENQQMHQRLDALEMEVQKEGLAPSGKPAPKFVSAMSDITLSGFVTASYFHDTSDPPGGISPGYLWNRRNDSFSLNKVKLTIASPPAEQSGEKFDAGFKVSLIAGQDAPIVNSGSAITGFDLLREAYVDFNIPLGTGLNVKAGELISLLNYESGDGGAVNNNFSQGFQWFFTGNGPAAGVQLGYTLTDWLDVKFRVQNGLYSGPLDNNSSKTFMGALDFKPTDKLWFNLIPFGGREDAGFAQSLWGGSLLAGYQATKQLNFGTELDYFNFHNPAGHVPAGDSPVWSTGLWASYDFTKQVGLAVRTEFLSDKDGVDASGGALGFPNSPGLDQDLESVALTLNYKPVPALKLQPEVRYDHSSRGNGFGTKADRVILGMGASYLF